MPGLLNAILSNYYAKNAAKRQQEFEAKQAELAQSAALERLLLSQEYELGRSREEQAIKEEELSKRAQDIGEAFEKNVMSEEDDRRFKGKLASIGLSEGMYYSMTPEEVGKYLMAQGGGETTSHGFAGQPQLVRGREQSLEQAERINPLLERNLATETEEKERLASYPKKNSELAEKGWVEDILSKSLGNEAIRASTGYTKAHTEAVNDARNNPYRYGINVGSGGAFILPPTKEGEGAQVITGPQPQEGAPSIIRDKSGKARDIIPGVRTFTDPAVKILHAPGDFKKKLEAMFGAPSATGGENFTKSTVIEAKPARKIKEAGEPDNASLVNHSNVFSSGQKLLGGERQGLFSKGSNILRDPGLGLGTYPTNISSQAIGSDLVPTTAVQPVIPKATPTPIPAPANLPPYIPEISGAPTNSMSMPPELQRLNTYPTNWSLMSPAERRMWLIKNRK